jgi:PIN domain nuclease of toxin-antitoxin system
MKILLDTHTFIWCDSDPSKLSATAVSLLKNPGNTVLVSVVSIWEMIIKQQIGKLSLKVPLRTILSQQQANGIQVLPMNLDHVLSLENLPVIHKDPFDRLLITQANVEGAALLSADAIFSQYAVNVVW